MFEPKKLEERDMFHRAVVSKWRSEDEVTSKQVLNDMFRYSTITITTIMLQS
jgi:hypothetical protein